MASLRSILCPVDFSEESREALRWAAALAQRLSGSLTVLNAAEPLLVEAARARFGFDLVHAEIEPALREFVRTTWPGQAAGPSIAAMEVRAGHSADVILDAAARGNCDLIVMGTHGLGGVRKWLLGSTTERVLRRTLKPVLAVPPGAGPPIMPDSAASGEARPIVAATDFSETSMRGVRWAAHLAGEMASPLLLVHVVEPLVVSPQWRSYVAEADEARVAEARTRLQALSGPDTGAARQETLVKLGRPADVIAALADDRRAAVIVMGLASGQGPLAPRPGAIAYRVLSLAKAAVLVVPPE